MWSAIFGKGNNILSNYEIGEVVAGDGESIFTLHRGTLKASNEQVSIFICNTSDLEDGFEKMATSAVHFMKTLRHPSILNYNDGGEFDNKIYVVTEAVVPVKSYLSELDVRHHDNIISCGVSRILSVLLFLNETHKLAHNNLTTGNIFVARNGDWKLGGVEFMSHVAESEYILKICSSRVKVLGLPPPAARRVVSSSIDLFCLGLVLWELYNNRAVADLADLGDVAKLPPRLRGDLRVFQGGKAGEAMGVLGREGHFLCNDYIRSVDFLDEIMIKSNSEKKFFFSQMDVSLFPGDVCQNKIFPALYDLIQFGSPDLPSVSLFLKIGETFRDYGRHVLPTIVALLKMTNRSVRCKMLQNAEQFGSRLDPKSFNEELFVPIFQGLYDTAPQLRECTVKAFEHFAPLLTKVNLKSLLSGLARIQQKDSEGGIRANATICVCRISRYLDAGTRHQTLIPLFSQATADSYPGAREAGILSFACTESYYTRQNIASRVMPVLCLCTIDPVREVRDHAFRTLEGFIAKLRAEGDTEIPAENTTPLASRWVSMAMSVLSTRLIPQREDKARASPEESSKKAVPHFKNTQDSSNLESQSDESDQLSTDKACATAEPSLPPARSTPSRAEPSLKLVESRADPSPKLVESSLSTAEPSLKPAESTVDPSLSFAESTLKLSRPLLVDDTWTEWDSDLRKSAKPHEKSENNLQKAVELGTKKVTRIGARRI